MATVLEIIERAWRRSGIIGAGVVINSVQKDIGLERLQDLYTGMTEGLFGELETVLLSDSTAYEAEEGQRVINTAAATVTLPDTVDDDDAVDGIRPPRDCSVVIVITPGSDPDINLYDINRGAWQEISALTTGDHAPLSGRFSDGLTNMLAVLIADDVGGKIPPIVAKMAAAARMNIASHYSSGRRPVQHVFY